MPLYEEIEIEDMTYESETRTYSYPCPCGDRFKVSLEDLWDGEDIAYCQSCTLFIQVIYEEADLPPLPDDNDDDEEEQSREDNGEEKPKVETKDSENGNGSKDNQSTEDVETAVQKLSISSQ